MNFTEKDLEKLLKKAKAEPSAQWHQAALNNLRLLAGKEDVTIQDEPRISLWHVFFNPPVMKKALSIMVALVLVVGAGLYYTSPGAAFARHLSRAHSALGELKAYTKGESPSTRQSLLPTAYAEDTTTAEEAAVVDLVLTVESETDASIEAVEGFDDLASTQEALDSLDALQDETVEVLGEVVITAESEVVVEIATEVIADTAEENTSVEEAIETAEEAEAAGEETVEIEIALATTTSADADETSNREAKTQERLDAVAELMASIDPASNPTVEFTTSMQQKFEAIQSILAACGSENPEERCNSGKAKGLATALSAKVRNEIRANARGTAANESEEGEDADDEDDQDEEGEDADDEAAEDEEDGSDGDEETNDEDTNEDTDEDESDESSDDNNSGEDNASLRGENSAGANANGVEVSTEAKLNADFGLGVAAEKKNRADEDEDDESEEE